MISNLTALLCDATRGIFCNNETHRLKIPVTSDIPVTPGPATNADPGHTLCAYHAAASVRPMAGLDPANGQGLFPYSSVLAAKERLEAHALGARLPPSLLPLLPPRPPPLPSPPLPAAPTLPLPLAILAGASTAVVLPSATPLQADPLTVSARRSLLAPAVRW